MTNDMNLIDHPDRVGSTELAGALLRAWSNGDRTPFEAELDRSIHALPEEDDSVEMERLQVLGAIAARLKTYEDPSLGSQDACVNVCASLLSHLACPPMPRP